MNTELADLKAQLDRIEKKIDALLEFERLSPTPRIYRPANEKPYEPTANQFQENNAHGAAWGNRGAGNAGTRGEEEVAGTETST